VAFYKGEAHDTSGLCRLLRRRIGWGLLQGGTRREVSPDADKEAIRDMASAITAAEERGDFNGFISFHTDDVVILPPDQPIVTGKAAFTALLQRFFDQFTLQETLSPNPTLHPTSRAGDS
jgi:SnoaL-like protein